MALTYPACCSRLRARGQRGFGRRSNREPPWTLWARRHRFREEGRCDSGARWGARRNCDQRMCSRCREAIERCVVAHFHAKTSRGGWRRHIPEGPSRHHIHRPRSSTWCEAQRTDTRLDTSNGDLPYMISGFMNWFIGWLVDDEWWLNILAILSMWARGDWSRFWQPMNDLKTPSRSCLTPTQRASLERNKKQGLTPW